MAKITVAPTCSPSAVASLSVPSASGAHRPSAPNRLLHELLVDAAAAAGELLVGK